MVPVSQRPAGDYASGDNTLNIAPSKLIGINEQLGGFVPELRIDVNGSFCLRDGVSLTGAPGNPPPVRTSASSTSTPADLGDATTGGNDGAVYQFLSLNGSGAWWNLPCWMHAYVIGGGTPGTSIPANVRTYLREVAACKSVADIKAVIAKYNPTQNLQDIETRWPWVQAAVTDAFNAELAKIKQSIGAIDGPGSTGMPFQIMGPVTNLGAAFGNALKASVSVNGAPATNLAVMPGTPPTVYDEKGQDVTASLAAQGVDAAALYAEMQAKVTS